MTFVSLPFQMTSVRAILLIEPLVASKICSDDQLVCMYGTDDLFCFKRSSEDKSRWWGRCFRSDM